MSLGNKIIFVKNVKAKTVIPPRSDAMSPADYANRFQKAGSRVAPRRSSPRRRSRSATSSGPVPTAALHRAGEAFVPRRRSVLARMAGQKPRRAQSSLALYELRKLQCDVAPGEPAGACGGLCLRSNVAGSARQRLSVRHVDRRHSWPRGIWLKPSDLGTIYYGNAERLLPWLGSKAHERT